MEDGCHTVDVVLRAPGWEKLGIKVDPPQNFTANKPSRPLADTICQTRLLTAQGWNLITVPHHEWRKRPTHQDKAAFLKQLLDRQLIGPEKEQKLDAVNDEERAIEACRAAAAAAANAAAANNM